MPQIDVTPQSTQILNSLSGLAGGIAEGGEAAAHVRAQQAAQSLAAQAQALHAQAVQDDMARAQRQEDLANQQRGAAQDAIGILTEQSGLPPTVAGVLRRMEPQHAAVAFKEFQTEGARRQLLGQIQSDEQNGAFADVGPDGEAKPNPERAAQAKEWTTYLEQGGDPTVVAHARAQTLGEIVGQRAQANIIMGHVARAQTRVGAVEQAGVDSSEAHRMLESAKIDPSLFEDKEWRGKFQDALRGYATASDGHLVSPTSLDAYEKSRNENTTLKMALDEMVKRSQVSLNEARARAVENPKLHSSGSDKPQRTQEMSPSPEALYQQSQKSAAENIGSEAWGKMTDEQKHAETLKQMGRIRSAKAGFAAMDEPAQAPQGEPTPEATNAAGAGAASKLASPALRRADVLANPSKYLRFKTKAEAEAWIEHGD